MKVTEDLVNKFGLPQAACGGYFRLHYERVEGTNLLTGNAKAELKLPDGRVYQAESKLNPKDKNRFSKEIARHILVGRLNKQVESII